MIWIAAGALVALVLTCALNVVLSVLLFDRLGRKDHEHAAERAQWVVERRELNQRIQAPEIATVQAIDVTRDGPAYVPTEDDEAFWDEFHSRQVTHG